MAPADLPPDLDLDDHEPVGYAAVMAAAGLRCLPHWHLSYLAPVNRRATHHLGDGRVVDVYPPSRRPRNGLVGQLVFALRYDGVSLEILKAAFLHIGPQALTAAIDRQPTSSFLRRLWFFYEWLLGTRIDRPDLEMGAYVPALPPDEQVVHPRPHRSRRHRVLDNLLGSPSWCPLVRRSALPAAEDATGHWAERLRGLLDQVDPALLPRAIAYFYTKETKSSYLIEREEPGANRKERFIALLRRADAHGPPTRAGLVELQQVTVDPRYASEDWRQDEVYVGETLPDFQERIHYVAPLATQVPEMMEGWLQLAQDLASPLATAPDPITSAAILSFGFVFIHPFDDGNGRLHRFLIHQVLSLRGFTPQGAVLPVSAVILQDRPGYDACLEQVSQPLLALVDHQLREDGSLHVSGDTGDHYRYLDLTRQVADLHRWLRRTIAEELPGELRLLERFDAVIAGMREIVDMPDRKRDLFIRCCRQNGGRLGLAKRQRQFAELSDAEVEALEQVLAEAFGS